MSITGGNVNLFTISAKIANIGILANLSNPLGDLSKDFCFGDNILSPSKQGSATHLKFCPIRGKKRQIKLISYTLFRILVRD
jgi:hypothetical protein